MRATAPRFTKRARFVDRESPEPEWKAVHRAADRNLGKVAAAFTGSLYVLRRDVSVEHLTDALRRGDPGMAVEAFDWDVWAGTLDRLATPRIAETMRAAGEAVGRKTIVHKQESTLQGVFDLLNPRAQRIAALIAAKLVTRVSDATKFAIRQVIADAQARGISIRDQAAEIARILTETAGLDLPRARRLERFRADMAARGVTSRVLQDRVGELRDRLLQDRARTIARTETMDSALAGQVELWDQATDLGLLDRGMLMEWIDTDDRRRCAICRSLDGQRVPRGQLFVSPYNGQTYERPTAHPRCRCALALVDPDEE